MNQVTRIDDVFQAMQRAKTGARAYCTNFFPDPKKLQGWIERGELSMRTAEGVTYFSRKDRDFLHLYFCSSDLETLGRGLGGFPGLKTEPWVVDLVGIEAGLADLLALWLSAGFRAHTRLVRLARAAQPAPAPSAQDTAPVGFAEASDLQAVIELLEHSFDRFAEQLPVASEVQAAIENRQIYAVKSGQAVAALLFFETQGFTSTLRYWVVAEAFRAHRFGGAVIRHYFAAQRTVRRFILWVLAQNQNAVEKYRHYGYAPDGLVDHVLVSEIIRP